MLRQNFKEVTLANSRHSKPDDRSNNVERIGDIIKNTEEKLHEAEISLEFADPMQSEMIKEKNKRRQKSIEGLKEEMQDEMAARKKGEV